MPYIPLEEHLPGITGLLEYRKDTAAPIRELTQVLMRGPSTLTEAERELIATIVSHRNECKFCSTAHTAAADVLLGEHDTCEKVKTDISTAPVSNKMKKLFSQLASSNINPNIVLSKFRGSMIGGLVGDCCGAPYENEILGKGDKLILKKFLDKLEGPPFVGV